MCDFTHSEDFIVEAIPDKWGNVGVAIKSKFGPYTHLYLRQDQLEILIKALKGRKND